MSDSLAGILLHQAEVMAELATDRVRLIAENNCLQARAEKAEAELESARPLLEAAKGCDRETALYELDHAGLSVAIKRQLRALLAALPVPK